MVSGDLTLKTNFTLDGLWPRSVPDHASFQITALFPDGTVEPLLWFQEYKAQWGHPFLLRSPIDLPKGTVIRGVPRGGDGGRRRAQLRYFSSLTGTSKCARVTTPLRWNCTHMR